jgi:hypothetical protein
MAEALTADPKAARLEQWRVDVEQLRVEAVELMQLHDEAVAPAAKQQFARLWADAAGRAFDLLWSAWLPELISSTAEASLVAGFPVFGRPGELVPPEPPVVHRPSWKQRQRLKAEAQEAAAAPITVIEEPEPLPEPEPVALVDEIEEEPTPVPEPPAPPSDGWVNGADLAKLLNCSWPTVQKYAREGLFDDHMRRPLPGEGRGKRFDPEACRAAVENRPDKRRRAKPKPPKPLRVSAAALANDPALLAQVEQLLASVRGES